MKTVDLNHAVVNNRGHVLDVFETPEEAQAEADRLNAEAPPDVFFWTAITHETAPQDIPGQGVFW